MLSALCVWVAAGENAERNRVHSVALSNVRFDSVQSLGWFSVVEKQEGCKELHTALSERKTYPIYNRTILLNTIRWSFYITSGGGVAEKFIDSKASGEKFRRENLSGLLQMDSHQHSERGPLNDESQ